MRLDLDDLEVQALRDAIDAYLPELESEASRTDRVRDAHPLWDRVRALQAIRARLDGGSTPTG